MTNGEAQVAAIEADVQDLEHRVDELAEFVDGLDGFNALRRRHTNVDTLPVH